MLQQADFINIIRDHEGLIYKVTKIYSNVRDDEQDLYQEIVYQLWKSFALFRNESKISTWIYRVALNTAITHVKRKKRQEHNIPLDEGLINIHEAHDEIQGEQSKILFDTIKKLSGIERAIILLYLEGKSYDEIATITGFSTTNVGTKLGRIKQKLKTLIN